MSTFWKAVPWVNRIIILLSAAIYIGISIQPLLHPGASALAQGLSITSPLGATIFRVAFAGLPLGCAACLVYSVLSRQRTLFGLVCAALLMGSLLFVRVYGMEVDGSVSQSMTLVIPEAVLTVLTLAGMALETGYRRWPLEG